MAKDVVIRLKLEKDKFTTGMMDVKVTFDMLYGAAEKVGRAFNDLMETGQKYSNLLQHNSIDISAARTATKGLVDDMTLLTAANTAAEFRMGLTSKQLAVFAKAAVVQSQKLGIDASKALDDLLTGTARGSKMILDNLGFIVKQGASVADVVAEINKKVGDQGVIVDGAGSRWAQLKIEVKNATDEFKKWIATSDGNNLVFNKQIEDVQLMGEAWRLLSGNIDDSYRALLNFGAYADMLGAGPLGDLFRATFMAKATGGKSFAQRLAGGEAPIERRPHYRAPTERAVKSAGGRGGRGGKPAGPAAGPYGLGGWRGGRIGQMQGEAVMRATEEREARYKIAESVSRQREELMKLYDAYLKVTEGQTKTVDPDLEFVARQEKKIKSIRALNTEFRNLAVGGLADFTGGIWAAADAAIMGSETFGMAMAKMLKQTLMSVAMQATVRGMFEMAEYVASWFTAVPKLKAAGMFFATAAVAGGAALGVSAGIRSAGGYDRGASRVGRGADMRDRTSRPRFGRRADKQAPIYVNVYLGSDRNPSAVLLAKEQAVAMIRRAA